ncbi:MAG: PIN domain-containing protein [Piscinibacter sp.]
MLDTNVVLDWLVFRDASTAVLDRQLAAGLWHWHVTTEMRQELEQVLTYESLAPWKPDRSATLAVWDGRARLVAAPAVALSQPLRCTDPDDQKFIELALSLPGATLLSRDRAVLKLARRARLLGVTITTPQAWSAALAGQGGEQV